MRPSMCVSPTPLDSRTAGCCFWIILLFFRSALPLLPSALLVLLPCPGLSHHLNAHPGFELHRELFLCDYDLLHKPDDIIGRKLHHRPLRILRPCNPPEFIRISTGAVFSGIPPVVICAVMVSSVAVSSVVVCSVAVCSVLACATVFFSSQEALKPQRKWKMKSSLPFTVTLFTRLRNVPPSNEEELSQPCTD